MKRIALILATIMVLSVALVACGGGETSETASVADTSAEASKAETSKVEETSEPADDSSEPADDSSEPADDSSEPADDSSEPADDSSAPAAEVGELISGGCSYELVGYYKVDGVPSWPDDTGKDLTDGKYAAEATYSDAAWVGLNLNADDYKAAGYAAVTVDLGSKQTVAKAVINISNLMNSGIGAPNEVKVAFSADGTTWSADFTLNAEGEIVDGSTVKYSAAVNAEAQYVKFMMVAGANTWIFVDEVEVYAAK